MREQTYTTRGRARERGGMFIPVPFDPDAVWGPKPVHHVNGTVGGARVRAVIGSLDGERGLLLGPSWTPGGLEPGTQVEVVLAPEGPQRADLADDLAAALEASPAAGAFFDGLAQFYRRAYLRWIDGTKRHPDLRAQRIAEVVALLESGRKQR
ncbi:YdeI/OmpD-associated family protein [Nonomuraea sp. NPDC050556]|uniref:YdeI/OmpD-associated family protein n=1 Tax=Nonomuraea sp. NPDC050556 TaxID=3364369 RepID=UPI0037A30D5F